MKRIISICLFLGVFCGSGWAQGGKVVTPRTINSQAAVVDSLQTGVRIAGEPVSGSASRRWYFGLGGGLDYSSSTGWYIDVCPDVAYRCSDALFVGGRVSYTYYNYSSMMGVIPYARLHFVPLGKAVTVFATMETPCYFWTDYLRLGAWARPGIGVRVAEGAYLLASYGALGYSYIRQGGVTGSGWTSLWDSDTLSIGIYFNL